jgi:transaldolase
MKKVKELKVKLFADGADKASMLEMYGNPLIQGLTTNPTLMRKAGVTDYRAFCKDILTCVQDKPLSLEVFSDDFSEMERQALEIANWGQNVYVKIPISNTKGESTVGLVKRLIARNVKVNVTAIMTLAQVRDVANVLMSATVPSYVSVFAGRIADTGRAALPLMTAAVELLKIAPESELIWASPRELYNIFEADLAGCHIITATPDVLKKLSLVGYDLDAYSLDTVKMFYDDAVAAGFKL